MDGFWTWLDLPPVGPSGSRLVRFSAIFPTSFYIDFRMHFGTDLASILEPFWIFVHHFGTLFSIVEFAWIFIEFQWIFGTLKPWKIQFSIDILVKKQRNHTFRFYIDFVSPFGHILAWFSEPFSMIFHIFSALIFGRIFECVFPSFWHQTGSQMAPKIDQEIQKKRKRCPPFQQSRPGLCFDPILDPFGTFWASSNHHLGAFWQESSIRNQL